MAKKSKSKAAKRAYKRSTAGAKAIKKNVRLLTVLIVLVLILLLVFAIWYKSSPDTLLGFFHSIFPSNDKIDPVKLHAEGEMTVHFVDVGQGDAIVIQFPGGENMIIDAGDRNSSITESLISYIDSLEITTFDYAMLTHSDADHSGGMDDVLNRYEVKNIYCPDSAYLSNIVTTQVYKKFLEAAQIEEQEGAAIHISTSDSDFGNEKDGWFFDFITPTAEQYKTVKNSAEKLNSISPILQLIYGDRKILFTGDANEITEGWYSDEVAKSGYSADYYDIDVLKVAHHGSRGSSTKAFLDIVKPEYAVISYGEGNSYSHPHAEALVRFSEAGIPDNRVYGTGEYGTIVLNIADKDGDGDYDMTFTSVKTGANLNQDSGQGNHVADTAGINLLHAVLTPSTGRRNFYENTNYQWT